LQFRDDPASARRFTRVGLCGPSLNSPLKLDAHEAVLAQHDRKFVVDLVAITVGDTVEFPIRGRLPHNLFSPRDPKFDFGTHKPGATPPPSRTFDKAAVVKVDLSLTRDPEKPHPNKYGHSYGGMKY
jgi:hypothetical protein